SDAAGTVFVVDDDRAVLRALARLFRAHALPVETFSSAKDFLDAHDPSIPGCLVLDIAMPGLTGLELQQALIKTTRMIVFLTGHSDVTSAVRAMHAGAVDFLIKPVDDKVLLAAVYEALDRDRRYRATQAAMVSNLHRLETLTRRERQVMEHV